MTYNEMRNRSFAEGYHVGIYGEKEPCQFSLCDTKIYAVHQSGYCWTGLTATEDHAIKEIENSRVWRVNRVSG